jgi:hypothetical protein
MSSSSLEYRPVFGSVLKNTDVVGNASELTPIAKSLSDRFGCIGGTPPSWSFHLSFGVPFDRVKPSFRTHIAYQKGGAHVSAGKGSAYA